MTNAELKLFELAVKLRQSYCDCNPEIGMGPWPDQIIDWVVEKSGITISDEERQIVKNRIWPRYKG